MPEILFRGKKVICKPGENLRKVLLQHDMLPYNGRAEWLNCLGLGTCGTCAVEIVHGEVSPATRIEQWRLNFPPHTPESGLRLACQCKVLSDLEIKKHPGFWGEHKSF